MKIDRYKIESSLFELQEKLGELTHHTKDVFQGLQDKSSVKIEHVNAATRSVYNGIIQPEMQKLYRKVEQSAGETYCKVSQDVNQLSRGNNFFKRLKKKVDSIVNPK